MNGADYTGSARFDCLTRTRLRSIAADVSALQCTASSICFPREFVLSGGGEAIALNPAAQTAFIRGGTGYIGSRLISRLLARGHRVRALVRPESQNKLPAGCEVVTGNALDASSYQNRIKPATTFIQLVGVAHPSPAKATEFQSVDLVAGREAIIAAFTAGIEHFVYVSVAQPARSKSEPSVKGCCGRADSMPPSCGPGIS